MQVLEDHNVEINFLIVNAAGLLSLLNLEQCKSLHEPLCIVVLDLLHSK